jgi:AcrR family transcriptional regulator
MAHQPQQARSRATLDRVIGAAETLFAERGEIGFTLPEVARRADVTVGTVYRRFDSKEELLMAVFDRVRGDEDETRLSPWEAVDWPAMSIPQIAHRLVLDISLLLREREALMRAIMARRLTVGDDDPVFQHGLQDVVRGAAQFERAILATGQTVTHADPHLAIEFAYRLIVSTSHRWAAREIEVMAPEPMSWEAMLENLADVVARYLFGNHANG